MSQRLTPADARESMLAHVAAKGAEIRARYGTHFGWTQLLQLLQDRTFVRYPCEIEFDATRLLSGEFAHAIAKGEDPEHGFTICVHPYFALQLAKVPHLVLYQIVAVNYGEFASADDAEAFGAAVLGLEKEEYYRQVCALADELDFFALAKE